MEKISARGLSEKEFDRIVELYIHCFNDEEKGENWTRVSAGQYFEDRCAEESLFYLAKGPKDHLAGVIVASPYEKSFISKEIDNEWMSAFYISLVAVDRSARKQGTANQLLQFFLGDMRQSGIENVVVRCRSENLPVQGLFAKHGFAELLEYESTLGGVTCMRKILHKAVEY